MSLTKNSVYLIAEIHSKHLLKSDLLCLKDHLFKRLQNIRVDLGINEKSISDY